MLEALICHAKLYDVKYVEIEYYQFTFLAKCTINKNNISLRIFYSERIFSFNKFFKRSGICSSENNVPVFKKFKYKKVKVHAY